MPKNPDSLSSPDFEEKKWAVRLYYLFLTLLAFLIHANHPLSSDEGSVLNAAWNLWHGGKMYADFWEFTAPGSAHLVYFSWKVTGAAHYGTAKIVSILLGILSGFFLLRCSRRLCSHPYAVHFTVLFWMIACLFYPLINYNTHSSFWAVCLLGILLEALHKPSKLLYFFAGAMAAITTLFLQTKGGFLTVCSASILFFGARAGRSSRNTGLVFFMLGWTGIFIAGLHPWPAQLLWNQWVKFPLQNQYLNHTLHDTPAIFLQCLFLAMMIFMAIRRRNRLIWALTIFQSGLFLSQLHLIDVGHTMINAFPFMIVLSVIIDERLQRLIPQKRNIFAFGLFVPVLLILSLVSANRMRNGNIYAHDSTAEKIARILPVHAIRNARYVYFGPFMPEMYFECAKPNPFPQSNMMVCGGSACQEKTLALMKSLRPELAFLNYEMVKRFGYQPNTPVDIYLRDHYRDCGNLKGTSINVRAIGHCPDPA